MGEVSLLLLGAPEQPSSWQPRMEPESECYPSGKGSQHLYCPCLGTSVVPALDRGHHLAEGTSLWK